ncbi:hypothetical protein Pav631_1474 [Pseudomonas avellanae BPIC 631]|nr:hypothetical protein Pav631_1474 [Pseudomonas avellanae BPIC 631]
MQLAAPVAADCQQGDVGVFTPFELIPGLLQDVVHEPGTILDQATDIAARPEPVVEDVSCSADRFLERRDGAGLQGQFGLKLAAIEQVWIYLRHGTAFLVSSCASVISSVRPRRLGSGSLLCNGIVAA